MRKVRITKLTDDEFNGQHPNGINVGYTKTGMELDSPQVGKRYYVDMFSTSPVVRINDDGTIKTTYSTYKIEYLDETSGN